MSGAEAIAAAGLGIALLTFLFAAALALRTRPRAPTATPPTMELGGERPAVAGLLANDFDPPADAVPATLLDLATRRWLGIEQYGDEVVIRLRSAGDGELRRHEQQVLDHVRGLAVDGVVPAAAMTTGPEDASAQWWKRFRKAVIEDARQAGLCRPRWAGVSVAVVWIGVLATFGCAWLAMEVAEESEDFRAVDAMVIGTFAAGMALGGIAGAITSSDRQRDTPAGLAVAGQWLGVRRFLADHADFASKPAAAVAVWDRYLAYASAFGLAPIAVAQLPLGTEDDNRAWSRVTGTWREVRVTYPKLRPGYGQHPLLALAVGLLTAAVAGWLLRLFAGVASDIDGGARWAAFGVAAVIGLAGAWAVVKAWRALLDSFQTSSIEGVLLRARLRETLDWLPRWLRWLQPEQSDRRQRYYAAVDTGATDRVRAWRVRPAVYSTATQGSRVRVSVTPRLGYVRAIQTAAPVPPPAIEMVAQDDDPELVARAQALAGS